MSEETFLADQVCVPCRGGTPTLSAEEQAPLLKQIPLWQVEDGHHLARDYKFDSFVAALDFTNGVGKIAEEQGHHPEVTVGWGHAKVAIWTHKIDGLTESDFILAAKIDRLY
jgi:4a-hydroxytetrahydrobiopterin dehydratase